MTASHIQILPSGPVKLIGLPQQQTTNTAVMGVSNARVFPRRLINNNNGTLNPNNNVLQGPKRCLFGSPAPGEIKSMYQEQMQKNRDHFIASYNFDIFNGRFVDEHSADVQESSSSTPSQSADALSAPAQNDRVVENGSDCCQHENLIEKELRAHQERLASSGDEDSNTANNQECDDTCNSSSTSGSRLLGSSAAAASSLKDTSKKCNSERLKPYSRQSLITDSFSLRKSAITSTTLSRTAQSIQISQLPRAQRAKLLQMRVEEQQLQREQQKKSATNPNV